MAAVKKNPSKHKQGVPILLARHRGLWPRQWPASEDGTFFEVLGVGFKV